jgi:4-hydroxythreonine-4-phosphate dehydrogenase
MLMVADNFRVALLSEHIPVSEVASQVTRENILSKLNILNQSLIKDFGIDKPKIAVLGLNPHAGDEGLIGKEDEEIIRPAIKEAKHNMLVMGPIVPMRSLRGVIIANSTRCWLCITTRA